MRLLVKLGLMRTPRPQTLRGAGAVSGWLPEGAQTRGMGGWLGATPSRLTADLPGGKTWAPNADIRRALAALRSRTRWLAQNNGHAQGFLRMLRRNVVGPDGFTLQMRVPTDRGDGQDENANRRLEAAFAEWATAGGCDVTGRLDFTDILQLVVAGIARDGEALLRVHRARRWSRFGFTLEVLDPSQLDESINGRRDGMPSGHIARMGVELDQFGRPAAYWMTPSVPNDDPTASRLLRTSAVRVPAAEIMHLFLPEWPHQARGIPWFAPSIRTMAMLDGYTEAELVAARISASKMGFYKLDADSEPPAELEQDGTLVQEATAGTFEMLPRGVSVEAYSPQHPTDAFSDFVAAALRPAAAALGVSYNAFANDAAGMNYSALRATELEDRDEFRVVQSWMVRHVARPIFAAWLAEAFINDALGGLPMAKAWKFNAPEFRPRGWQWVDPLKEVNALREEIALGVNSRTRAVAARGGDVTQIAEDLRREAALFEGLVAAPTGAPAQPAPPETDPET